MVTKNPFHPSLHPFLSREVATPPTAKDAYPITGLTFLLVPKQAKNESKQQVVKQFAEFIVRQGQNTAESLDYAKLPQGLAEQDQKLLTEIGGSSGSSKTSDNQVPHK